MTDNDLTDRIFNDATSIKSQRKRTKQVYYDFKEAQVIHDKKVLNKEGQGDGNEEEGEGEGWKARNRNGGVMGEACKRFKNRPYSFESIQMQTIVSNYNLLQQMGFIEPQVLQNETISNMMSERDNTISMIKKRGRPKKFDLTYEDMQKYTHIMPFSFV